MYLKPPPRLTFFLLLETASFVSKRLILDWYFWKTPAIRQFWGVPHGVFGGLTRQNDNTNDFKQWRLNQKMKENYHLQYFPSTWSFFTLKLHIQELPLKQPSNGRSVCCPFTPHDGAHQQCRDDPGGSANCHQSTSVRGRILLGSIHWLVTNGITLPETNSSPLKINGWKMNFLLGWSIFRGYVSFGECNLKTSICRWYPK